jgi:hypothetical protein
MRRSEICIEIFCATPPGNPVSICQRKKAAIILARILGGKRKDALDSDVLCGKELA